MPSFPEAPSSLILWYKMLCSCKPVISPLACPTISQSDSELALYQLQTQAIYGTLLTQWTNAPSTRIRIFLNPQLFLSRLKNFTIHT